MHRRRRLVTMAGVVAMLLLVPAAGASAASATRQVQVLDDCDPATFNAMFGPGTCVKDGGTTVPAFVGQLLAQGRAPAWRFAPGQLKLDAGGRLAAHNRGGEDHTFTHRGGHLRRRLHPRPQRPAGADPGAGVCGVPRPGPSGRRWCRPGAR